VSLFPGRQLFPAGGAREGLGSRSLPAPDATTLPRRADRVFSPERLLSQGLVVQLQWPVGSSIKGVGGALPKGATGSLAPREPGEEVPGELLTSVLRLTLQWFN